MLRNAHDDLRMCRFGAMMRCWTHSAVDRASVVELEQMLGAEGGVLNHVGEDSKGGDARGIALDAMLEDEIAL